MISHCVQCCPFNVFPFLLVEIQRLILLIHAADDRMQRVSTRTHNDFYFFWLDGIVIGTVYELTLLTAFKRSWFLLSSCPIMPIEPSPPPMPPNPNFKSFCTNDGWCKWLPTNPPTPWFPRCPPLCGPWPCEFCADSMAAWSCCCCCWDLWCCCCCCWDDFIESCFIFSCSSRSRLACVRQFIRFLSGSEKRKKKN